jgi:hypothetical protein
MSINYLHLNGVTSLAPVFTGNLLPFHAQVLNHALLIIFIERNGSLTLAAVAALLAIKYF